MSSAASLKWYDSLYGGVHPAASMPGIPLLARNAHRQREDTAYAMAQSRNLLTSLCYARYLLHVVTPSDAT